MKDMKLTLLYIIISVVFLFLQKVLCFIPELRNNDCYAERISDQSQFDLFVKNVSARDNDNTTKCIELLLIRNNLKLDLLRLMRMNLGTNGSLMIVGDSITIDCYSDVTDLEELRDMLQPISRALLVLFDGLVFSKCPVPIVIEEMSNVMIQNCVFL